MLPKYHVLLGLAFSVLIFLIFPDIGFLGLLLIFLSSVLIDVDYYFYYVYKNKDWSLMRAYRSGFEKDKKLKKMSKLKRSEYFHHLTFLHGIEFILALILLSFVSHYFFFVFLGVLFHLILDVSYDFDFFENRIDKISIINDSLKYKNIKYLK